MNRTPTVDWRSVLSQDDPRVRLAHVLEEWAPGGGIECHVEADMDFLLTLLDRHGLSLSVSRAEIPWLEQIGPFRLSYDSDLAIPYSCGCGQWSNTDFGTVDDIKREWRQHVTVVHHLDA